MLQKQEKEREFAFKFDGQTALFFINLHTVSCFNAMQNNRPLTVYVILTIRQFIHLFIYVFIYLFI